MTDIRDLDESARNFVDDVIALNLPAAQEALLNGDFDTNIIVDGQTLIHVVVSNYADANANAIWNMVKFLLENNADIMQISKNTEQSKMDKLLKEIKKLSEQVQFLTLKAIEHDKSLIGLDLLHQRVSDIAAEL